MSLTAENKGRNRARAVCYLRVSTDEQAQSGAGLDAQRFACAGFAERAGLDLAGPFSDEGIGGAVPVERRPGLLAALAAGEPGDTLVVAKRDRLGRDPVIVAMIERLAQRRGLRVASAAGEGTDGDGPSDILMRRIIDSFAEFERLIIKSRTLAAMASLRRRGRKSGTVPFGLAAVDDGTPSRSGGMPARLVDAPAELEALELMRGLAADGLSYRRIAAGLDARGVPSRSGRPWCSSTVYKLLVRDRADRAEAGSRSVRDPA